jgi:hypothetical protein
MTGKENLNIFTASKSILMYCERHKTNDCVPVVGSLSLPDHRKDADGPFVERAFEDEGQDGIS